MTFWTRHNIRIARKGKRGKSSLYIPMVFERDTLGRPLELPEQEIARSAAEVRVPGRSYDAHRNRYLASLAAIRPTLLDDQVKLNDPGASQYVINTLAKDGWNGLLRFHEGEIWRLRNRQRDNDEARAAQGVTAPGSVASPARREPSPPSATEARAVTRW